MSEDNNQHMSDVKFASTVGPAQNNSLINLQELIQK